MKILKSHFWYNKSQRNGIFVLITLLIIFQIIIFQVDFSQNKIVDLASKKVLAFNKKIDSLKAIEIEKSKPKIYPFNPNYITDFKGAQLGMSLEEIDRLLAFRQQNKFVNSKEEFQKVTKVSDSLLRKIAPYFKFPDWVTKRNQSKKSKDKEDVISSVVEKSRFVKSTYKVSTTDINKATAKDLTSIKGIGEVLSKRIINYRNRLQGFTFESQLYEVWKIDSTVIDRLLNDFKIQSKPEIKKVNINTASFKEVLKNPYIDYELCKAIFEFRNQIAEYQDLSELKKIPNFPLDKYDRIVLYLLAE